jgi:4-hydroxy-tetrahydrodipicolinate reductase
LEAALSDTAPDVLVDFTTPQTVAQNALAALAEDVRLVIGTTGMSSADLEEIRGLCETKGIGAVVAPNFAIGAVLMMHFAQIAARHMPCAEIIELHHDKKLDAPSGTALKTADMISQTRPEANKPPGDELPSRGQWRHNIPIHSIRLPGLVAHQEVIFGGFEQTLTIRHDSLGRGSFMPGVALAIRKVMELNHLVYGLENLLEL